MITSDDHDHASFVSTPDVADPLPVIKEEKRRNEPIYRNIKTSEFQANNTSDINILRNWIFVSSFWAC